MVDDLRLKAIEAYEALYSDYITEMRDDIKLHMIRVEGINELNTETESHAMVERFRENLRACKRDPSDSNIAELDGAVCYINTKLRDMDRQTLEPPLLFINDYVDK
ncbi:hypothetical protein [Shewanella algae]|uniref:hypothetical protein n=1 Tax=Shewanella algae TaxID=38313 RepID=UPI0011845795|nr:hypothetical protein [Shewanella algae]QGS59725.1 hypothetical protein GMX02_09465 [Shewanella algae]TVL33040.1 hypothetical protein AYI94_17960 [Shewanella algae]